MTTKEQDDRDEQGDNTNPILDAAAQSLSSGDMDTLQKQYGLTPETMKSQGFTPPSSTPPPKSIVQAAKPPAAPPIASQVPPAPPTPIAAPPSPSDLAKIPPPPPESIVPAAEAGAGAGGAASLGPAAAAAYAGIELVKAGHEGLKSPQGSISQFMPAGGGGGQQDPMPNAMLQAMQAIGNIRSRM